jgi:His-Xaa-Ser system protein HxsD
MKKEISLIKSLYKKEAILYTINLYLEDYKYEIWENDKEFILNIKEIDDKILKNFKQELNFNNLRFEIADNNKELRKVIISKALWSINVE